MILRFVACLLLLSQLGLAAQPASLAMSAGHDTTCMSMTEHSESAVLDSARDCEMCEMPGCGIMHACSFTVPAVVPAASPTLAHQLTWLSNSVPAGWEAGYLTAPIPPPPKP